MKQAERLAKLQEIDGDIGRLKIKVQEAKGRLKDAEGQRAKLLKDCTHRDARGKPAGEAGLFGNECTICQARDF